MLSIIYPNPNNPLYVPVGELMGCLNAWVSVFKPTQDFKIYPIPRYPVKESLIPILNNGLHRIFGLDVILRSIAKYHIPAGNIQDTAQAMPEFVVQNNNLLNNHVALSLNGNNVEGVVLLQAAIDSWYNYSRIERLSFCKFGNERLSWVCEYANLNINTI